MFVSMKTTVLLLLISNLSCDEIPFQAQPTIELISTGDAATIRYRVNPDGETYILCQSTRIAVQPVADRTYVGYITSLCESSSYIVLKLKNGEAKRSISYSRPNP